MLIFMLVHFYCFQHISFKKWLFLLTMAPDILDRKWIYFIYYIWFRILWQVGIVLYDFIPCCPIKKTFKCCQVSGWVCPPWFDLSPCMRWFTSWPAIHSVLWEQDWQIYFRPLPHSDITLVVFFRIIGEVVIGRVPTFMLFRCSFCSHSQHWI